VPRMAFVNHISGTRKEYGSSEHAIVVGGQVPKDLISLWT